MLTNIHIARYRLYMQAIPPYTDALDCWHTLRNGLLETRDDIARGKMMSADALTYEGKVFCFYSTKGGRVGLGCRVGRNTDLRIFGLNDWQYLAPFKSKPPMKDWSVIGMGDVSRWREVAEYCLKHFHNKGTGE